jgi:hypothetical protein
VLQAQYVDADGQDNLSATFAWQELPSGTVNAVAGPSRTANNNGTVTLNLGSGAEGKQYQFRVQTNDGHNLSPWSDWCTFTIDATAPAAPVITPTASGTAPVYVRCDPVNISTCTARGGPGIAGAFVFSEPTGQGPDVTRYVYGWDSPSITVTVSAGGASSPILLTPPRYGLNVLKAYSVDGAGKQSPTSTFYFLVSAPSNAVAYWPLDDIDSHGFADQVSGGTLTTSNVTWTPDARYNGANAATFSAGQAVQPVPGLDTSGSFSVAAWTRLSPATCYGNATAVAVDADPVIANNHSSAFFLSYDCTNARWRMRVAAKNAGSPALAEAVSANNSVVAGRWTFVVGTYDEAANVVKLWLDGVLVSATTPSAGWVTGHGTGWKATGPVTIGRDRFADADGGRFAGEIADVRLWNRALVDQDIAGANADPSIGVFTAQTALTAPRAIGQWSFPDGECWCADSPDGSGFERRLTLVPNWTIDPAWSGDPATTPAWLAAGGHDGNGGLMLDGVAGYATTADDAGTLDPSDDVQHPVLRTDQSFTVSAWVNPAAVTGIEVVLRQGIGSYSGTKLELNASGRWAFWVRTPDGTGGSFTTTATSSASASIGEWTHLVGVFDAPTGQVRLYVDGVRVTTASGAAGWASTESLQIGSTDGSQYFDGAIDQVQVFQGAMNDREVAALYTQS